MVHPVHDGCAFVCRAVLLGLIVVASGCGGGGTGQLGTTGTGVATLSWTPPTTNTDGSVLNDLAGYKIYYGTTPGSYPNAVTVDNPGLSDYVVENLAPGTYHFVVTAFDSAGNESAYSNVASKTVQ